MIAVAALPLWQARGPRFLALLVIGWIGMRLLSTAIDREYPIDPVAHIVPAAIPQLNDLADIAPAALLAPRSVPTALRSPQPTVTALASAAARPDTPLPSPGDSIWSTPQRHKWRLALFTSLLPRAQLASVGVARRPVAPVIGSATSPTLPPVPRWPAAATDRWSLALYSQWRGDGGNAALAANRPPALGGSQSGARLDYRLDDAGRWRAFARATASPLAGGQADVALGVTLRPKAALPVELHIEHRIAVAGTGRDRTLAYVSGGIDERPLAQGFRLSAYAQGGMAGPADAEVFADGALVIDRPLLADKRFRLSIGAVMAGAAQRGAARVDLGPRATLLLPTLGEGTRVALDWRERVAGNARPGSGAVLALSAGF